MSVLNAVKRTCLILLAITYYRNQVRPVTFAGTALIVVGVLAYTLEKSRAAAVAGSEATERTVALSLRKRVRIPSSAASHRDARCPLRARSVHRWWGRISG